MHSEPEEDSRNYKERGQNWREWRAEGRRWCPQRVFLDGRKSRRWAGIEVGMCGLLFLACLAICPGVKMCTHRGCPWARGGGHWLATSRGQWVRVSPGGGSHPFLGLLTPPPSPLHLPTPQHTASSVTVRYACTGLPGSRWPCENQRGCLPGLQSLLKLG